LDVFPAFTEMTGLMDLNDSDHTVKLIILLIETAGKSSYANHLCPVISVKAGKESQRKINCTNKKSAFAGMTKPRQAAGNASKGIQNTNASMFKIEKR